MSWPDQPPNPCAMRNDVVRDTPGMPAHLAARYTYPEQSRPLPGSLDPPQRYFGCRSMMKRSCVLKDFWKCRERHHALGPAEHSADNKNNSRHNKTARFCIVSYRFHPVARRYEIHKKHQAR